MPTDNSNQKRIYDLIEARGYGPEAQGLGSEQFAARQIVKALEELMELTELVSLNGVRLSSLLRAWGPRQLFDDRQLWQYAVITDPVSFDNELADTVIPLFCAAQARRVKLDRLALAKAAADVKRGERRNGGDGEDNL